QPRLRMASPSTKQESPATARSCSRSRAPYPAPRRHTLKNGARAAAAYLRAEQGDQNARQTANRITFKAATAAARGNTRPANRRRGKRSRRGTGEVARQNARRCGRST